MRIVHYHPRAAVGDGGITNSVKRLSAALVAEGHDAVIAYDQGERHGSDRGVKWQKLAHTGPRQARIPRGVSSAMEGADLLVLNSGWTPSNVAAGRAAERSGVPYVLAPRGAYDPQLLDRRRLLKRVWWNAVERRLVLRALALHVFFESQEDHLRALGYAGPYLVAPNGVAAPDGVAWDGGSGGYILYMGRFDPEHKGIDLLVRAVAHLAPARRPALRLHGPDWRGGKRRIVEMVRELGLEDWITVGAPVYGSEKWELLSRAIGFVYPSRWEGFGNSLAEAAAIGVPGLATPYPLAAHLAQRGAAFLSDAEPSSLADGLLQLRSPDAGDVGARAAAVVRAELTWRAVARRWVTQAEGLLENRRTP